MATDFFAFSKYSGAGNDFIMVDDRKKLLSDLISREAFFVKKVCCRRKGIGADGLILLQSGLSGLVEMRIFNADGSEAEMCGNGLRCFKRFAEECGIQENPLCVKTYDRVLTALSDGPRVQVFLGESRVIEKGLSLSYLGVEHTFDFLHTGVPHLVFYRENIDDIDVEKFGAHFRHHARFAPEGTNVNFIEQPRIGDESSSFRIRTYERGVERETWACGTGAAAAAISLHLRHKISLPISLHTRGGDILTIDFHQEADTIKELRLLGAAEKVYSGKMELK